MALDREGSGRYRPVDVLAQLLADKARLWIAWDAARGKFEAAAVTDIIEFPERAF